MEIKSKKPNLGSCKNRNFNLDSLFEWKHSLRQKNLIKLIVQKIIMKCECLIIIMRRKLDASHVKSPF